MADASPLTAKQVDQIMVIYADGSNRIIDGPALNQFLEWLTAVQAVLAAAKTLAPVLPQEAIPQ